ncbi:MULTISPECIES: PAS domain-containing protein [Mesorhizobium]|uniref:PAS domain-containing protein n=1 Tax=Mesorhizobium TaxID=68287 RepID=UPI0006889858|nr:PAS domain-containing protein [Mesorhizobium sp. LNHC229A00]
MNNLARLVEVPTLLSGNIVSEVVCKLLDTLMDMLRLDFAYVRLNQPAHEAPVEVARAGQEFSVSPQAIISQFQGLTDVDLANWPSPKSFQGDAHISIVALRLGMLANIGVLFAGSRRADFPLRTDSLVLNVAANQAGVRLQELQLSSDRKRLAKKANEIAEGEPSEVAVRESEDSAKLIADSIPAGIAVLTPTGEIEAVNSYIAGYFGKPQDELKRWETAETVHPADLQRVVDSFKHSIKAGKPYELETRLLGADGKYRWFQIRGLPLRDRNGRIMRWYALHIDIDERKRAEEALRESEVNLRKIINTIPTSAWSTLPDGYCDFLNDRWLDYAGFTAEQAEGWAWAAAIHPDDVSGLAEYWKSCLASGTPVYVEARIRRFDGEYRWFLFLANPLRDESGTIIRWYGTNVDIEDRKRADQALRDSEVNLRKIINTIPTSAWSTLPDGYCDFLNDRWLDYAGFTAEQAEGWAWAAAIHPDDASGLAEYWKSCLASGTPVYTEARIRRFDGEYRWFLFLANPLRDESGAIIRWYGTNVDIEDRKRADQALRESERNLRQIINTIPTAIWSTRPDGYCDFLHDRWLDFTGLSMEQAEGWGWRVAIHPDDYDALERFWTASLTSGTSGETEARMRRFDGEYRWFLFLGDTLRDEAGNIIRWYGTNVEIDDRKRAEQALAESERQSRLIVNTIPGLVAIFNADGEPESLNKQFLEYLGQTLEEFANWAANGTVHPDDLKRHIDALTRALETSREIDFETRLRRFDGVYRWFQLRGQPLRASDGCIVRWYVLMTDIDDRKRAEEELRRSEAFLAEGQNLARIGSFSWDVSKAEIVWSEQLYRIFDLQPGLHVTLQLIGSRFHPEDMPMLGDMIERAGRGEDDLEYRHRIITSDRSMKHLHLIAHGMRNSNGGMEYIGAILDVTQRWLSEEALEKVRTELGLAMRIMSLGALTASIAHEVNQPIAGIITNAGTCLRMLADDPPNIDGARETARRTIRDGNRAADVIKRLRALFSKQAAVVEPVDLNEAIREVIALSSGELERSSVSLRTKLAIGLPMAAGDRVQLQQVIMNLLRNAVDALMTVNDRPRRVVIATELGEDGNIQLSVQDTGIGFGAQDMEQIFEAFYTTKAEGMGIGLSVSRSIVENHHGRIWAEANGGPGATFYFSVPEFLENRTSQNAGLVPTPCGGGTGTQRGF